MITKTKSNTFAKVKYMFLLPICILLISAFTKPTIDHIPVDYTVNFHEIDIAPPSLFPVKGASRKNISSYFLEKGKHPKINKDVIHTGIDIRAKIGTSVLATADGIVGKASAEGNWGNLIVITHSNGYETWYAHLNGFNIKENQDIKKGDIIGYVGNTGLSTGPHLHYEVKQHGKQLNPLDFIE